MYSRFLFDVTAITTFWYTQLIRQVMNYSSYDQYTYGAASSSKGGVSDREDRTCSSLKLEDMLEKNEYLALYTTVLFIAAFVGPALGQ